MIPKKCPNCEELVDEAKAFCPGCGNSFDVEQKRKADSEFELTGGTVQFGKSALNSMLSEMGLNISETPEKKAKQVAPLPSNQAISRQAEKSAPRGATKGKKPALIIAVALLTMLFIAAFVAAATLYLVYRTQL